MICIQLWFYTGASVHACASVSLSKEQIFSVAPMQMDVCLFAYKNNNMPIVWVKPAGEKTPFHLAAHRWRKFRQLFEQLHIIA